MRASEGCLPTPNCDPVAGQAIANRPHPGRLPGFCVRLIKKIKKKTKYLIFKGFVREGRLARNALRR